MKDYQNQLLNGNILSSDVFNEDKKLVDETNLIRRIFQRPEDRIDYLNLNYNFSLSS